MSHLPQSEIDEKIELPRLASGHDVGLEYHRVLLDDPIRMDFYERAIRALVRPGDVVMDLGCGTGILAMLAARRGAARVYAVESTAVAALASEIVRANHLEDCVRVYHQDAITLEPVEPVDLIVSDFIGRFLIDDGMLPVVAACRRWLKPSGRFCPSGIRLVLVPVGDIFLQGVDLFTYPVFGLDFSAAQFPALHTCYHATLLPQALMATEETYACYDPLGDPIPFDSKVTFTIHRAGRLQGLAGWFEATLAPGIVLSSEPGIDTHWGQYLFPLPPADVLPGDELTVRLWERQEPVDSVWNWRGHIARDGVELFEFSLDSVQRFEVDRDLDRVRTPDEANGSESSASDSRRQHQG